MSMSTLPALTGISARSYSIPTSSLEADGTIAWNHTTLVVVKLKTGAGEGIGYTYASQAAESIIKDSLWLAIGMRNLSDIPACWQAMRQAVRNIGQPGLASCAIAAVDIALWDIKAKVLNVPLAHLLGKARDSIEVYGSGGFTTYGPDHIREQIGGWAQDGIRQFKIKIGKEDETDKQRIDAALGSLPPGGALLVDANGAYHPKQALAMADYLRDRPVTWFEEPVSSDDIPGLRYMREHSPAGMDIAAGEYAYTLDDARRLLESDAVDVLQIDATRAQGITGFLNMAAQAEAFHRPISAHCAPAVHVTLCCHAIDVRHLEYFWDHARIERMVFDGAPDVKNGHLTPHDTPGFGLALKEKDIEEFAL